MAIRENVTLARRPTQVFQQYHNTYDVLGAFVIIYVKPITSLVLLK
jgi:hypothetical protein